MLNDSLKAKILYLFVFLYVELVPSFPASCIWFLIFIHVRVCLTASLPSTNITHQSYSLPVANGNIIKNTKRKTRDIHTSIKKTTRWIFHILKYDFCGGGREDGYYFLLVGTIINIIIDWPVDSFLLFWQV